MVYLVCAIAAETDEEVRGVWEDTHKAHEQCRAIMAEGSAWEVRIEQWAGATRTPLIQWDKTWDRDTRDYKWVGPISSF
jgi:hypothetical protein